MNRTESGNCPWHELILENLFDLQGTVRLFLADFEPENGFDDCLEDDAEGLLYQVQHFISCFESSLRGGAEALRERSGKSVTTETQRHGEEQEVSDQSSVISDAGETFPICPWHVSAN